MTGSNLCVILLYKEISEGSANMQIVTDVATMRRSDAATVAGGIPGRELMYRAALGVFESRPWQGPVAIVCGSGNNAGDGYALAELLFEAEIACTVFMLSERTSPDGEYYLARCRDRGIPTVRYTKTTSFSDYTEIVDCILGTGFCGEVRGDTAEAVEKINQSGKFVISVDINSGLDGNSGLSRLCVHSHLTVSIGCLKPGLLLNCAKDVIGSLVNVDIGIGLEGSARYLCEKGDFTALLKERKRNSHKGSYGYVSLLGGCSAYAGALKLANLSCAALRSGCGVARLILPEGLLPAVAPYLLESTVAVLPESNGSVVFDAQALDKALAGQAALAVGMGWGRAGWHAEALTHILERYDIPIVIDADGINALAEMELEILKSTRCRVILTPHPKEMERLCGASVDEILQAPVELAERFAREYGVILLLKGACTVVTDGKETYFVDRGCAGMATAGSGDVLSGVLAGLLGFCSPCALTVACGAYIAGYAGELAERDVNSISMIASDTVSHIAEAIGHMMK